MGKAWAAVREDKIQGSGTTEWLFYSCFLKQPQRTFPSSRIKGSRSLCCFWKALLRGFQIHIDQKRNKQFPSPAEPWLTVQRAAWGQAWSTLDTRNNLRNCQGESLPDPQEVSPNAKPIMEMPKVCMGTAVLKGCPFCGFLLLTIKKTKLQKTIP